MENNNEFRRQISKKSKSENPITSFLWAIIAALLVLNSMMIINIASKGEQTPDSDRNHNTSVSSPENE